MLLPLLVCFSPCYEFNPCSLNITWYSSDENAIDVCELLNLAPLLIQRIQLVYCFRQLTP